MATVPTIHQFKYKPSGAASASSFLLGLDTSHYYIWNGLDYTDAKISLKPGQSFEVDTKTLALKSSSAMTLTSSSAMTLTSSSTMGLTSTGAMSLSAGDLTITSTYFNLTTSKLDLSTDFNIIGKELKISNSNNKSVVLKLNNGNTNLIASDALIFSSTNFTTSSKGKLQLKNNTTAGNEMDFSVELDETHSSNSGATKITSSHPIRIHGSDSTTIGYKVKNSNGEGYAEYSTFKIDNSGVLVKDGTSWGKLTRKYLYTGLCTLLTNAGGSIYGRVSFVSDTDYLALGDTDTAWKGMVEHMPVAIYNSTEPLFLPDWTGFLTGFKLDGSFLSIHETLEEVRRKPTQTVVWVSESVN